jgi:hypothetical protein
LRLKNKLKVVKVFYNKNLVKRGLKDSLFSGIRARTLCMNNNNNQNREKGCDMKTESEKNVRKMAQTIISQ